MRKAFVAAFAALIGMGTSAYAADLGGSMKDAPVYDSYKSWTGLYIGVGIGGGASVTDLGVNLFDEDESLELFGLDGIGGEGILGTAQIGYDYQLSQRLVIGAFADYDFSGISTEFRILENSVDVDLDNMWTIGGRFGFLATPDTLVYALVGYTQGEYTADDFDFNVDVQGWSVGGGIETRLTENWSLKGEYRFTQFDSETLFSIEGEGGGASLTAEPSVHTARAVLSYRLNPFERGLEGSK
jgi:outer membrane immunogenic protein